MTRRFDLLVFDWDGTLMDSVAHIVASIQGACRDLGVRVPDDAACRHVIGLGLQEAISTAVPHLDGRDYPALVERYRAHFFAPDKKEVLFDGVEEAVKELHAMGYQLAVATGKSQPGLQRTLRATGLAPYFHTTRCADQCPSKPHPAMLEEIMEELHVPPSRTVMIGDTTHDLLMAQNAGVASLAACYGAHPAADLALGGPLASFSSFGALVSWIKQHG